MAISDLKYHEITGLIIGAAIKVHKFFGYGFPEIVYKRALVIELEELGLDCQQELIVPIFYKGRKIYSRKLDLLVENKVLVELKAIKDPDNATINQILNYMNVFSIDVGLVLNFGTPRLFTKRFVLNKPIL